MNKEKSDCEQTDVPKAGADTLKTGVEIMSYEKPVLISYGDVRDITLGPTVGEGESGCAFFFQSGPGGCP